MENSGNAKPEQVGDKSQASSPKFGNMPVSVPCTHFVDNQVKLKDDLTLLT
jgi:hypothetical protein